MKKSGQALSLAILSHQLSFITVLKKFSRSNRNKKDENPRIFYQFPPLQQRIKQETPPFLAYFSLNTICATASTWLE
jgi:hypothetical protein